MARFLILTVIIFNISLSFLEAQAQEVFVASFKGETAITYKPTDPKIIVAGSNDYAGTIPRSASHRTLNGGHTSSDWLTVTLPLPSGKTDSADPTVDYDANGNVYFCFTAFNVDAALNPIEGAIYVAKSTNNGQSWGTPVTVHEPNGDHDDKPWMIVDRSRTPNRIYVAWTIRKSNGVGELWFSYSTDGGASFPSSNRQRLRTGAPDASNFVPRNHGVAMAVKPTGTNQPLYVVWVEDWLKSTVVRNDNSTIFVRKSNDGGVTFQSEIAIKSNFNSAFDRTRIGSFRYNSFPSIAVNPVTGGYIHLAWCEWENGTTLRIHTKRSTDGSSWTTEKTLSPPISSTEQWSPFVTINNSGKVFISFYNFDISSNAHLFSQSSADNGTNYGVSYPHSTVSSNAQNGKNVTDYIGAIAPGANPAPTAAWMDFRNGAAGSPRGDVFIDQKGHRTSNVVSALSANSQRKLVTNQTGTQYHLIYESNGEIWYTKSTDEGSTWSVEELVSAGSIKGKGFPAIAINQNNGYLYACWQRDLGNGSYEIYFSRRTTSWSSPVLVATVSPPSGTKPQPVITIKRSSDANGAFNKLLVMYISSSNSLRYKTSTNEGSTWSTEQTLNASGRFRPSVTQPWGLTASANRINVISDTGLKMYTRRYITNFPSPPDPEGWFDYWDSEELVQGSSDPSYLSVINGQVSIDFIQLLDVVWELDQNLGQGPIDAVCYQRKSYYTGQWSAMQEFVGSNFQKPTITTLSSQNLVLVWSNGVDVYQAKYTYSTNSWSGASNLGSGVDPQISTSGGAYTPSKAKYIFRNGSTFPYALNIQSGPAFQKVAEGEGSLSETYARRISISDTLTGAGFLVELEIPKVKSTNGDLYELPFVVTNDTLLNLSLDNLAGYLSTQSGTLPLEADSLILDVKIHSQNAASLKESRNAALVPRLKIKAEQVPALTQTIDLPNLDQTPILAMRKSVGLQTLKGQPVRLEFEVAGLNKTRPNLIPVLTHVHYLEKAPALTKGTLDNLGTLVEIPQEFGLEQNYPNPFNPSTVIRYAIPKSSLVTLRIFNLRGQEIATLVEKEHLAGHYEAQWDGRDHRGQPVAAGMYFYQLTAGDFRQVKRMVMVK